MIVKKDDSAFNLNLVCLSLRHYTAVVGSLDKKDSNTPTGRLPGRCFDAALFDALMGDHPESGFGFASETVGLRKRLPLVNTGPPQYHSVPVPVYCIRIFILYQCTIHIQFNILDQSEPVAEPYDTDLVTFVEDIGGSEVRGSASLTLA